MKSKLPIISVWTYGEYIINSLLGLSMLTIISPIHCFHSKLENDHDAKCSDDPQIKEFDIIFRWISLFLHVFIIVTVYVHSKYHTLKYLNQKVPL